MLSLSNVFSDDDFYKFEERVLKRLNTDKTTFSVEPKFDGIGISLTYENGKLTKAVTRGDGEIGEVVTDNIKTIAKVPHVIEHSSPKTIEIREKFLDLMTLVISTQSLKLII